MEFFTFPQHLIVQEGFKVYSDKIPIGVKLEYDSVQRCYGKKYGTIFIPLISFDFYNQMIKDEKVLAEINYFQFKRMEERGIVECVKSSYRDLYYKNLLKEEWIKLEEYLDPDDWKPVESQEGVEYQRLYFY